MTARAFRGFVLLSLLAGACEPNDGESDGGAADATVRDAASAPHDADTPDAGSFDAAAPDASPGDAGSAFDAGEADAGTDAAAMDAAVEDGGREFDAATQDAASDDGGSELDAATASLSVEFGSGVGMVIIRTDLDWYTCASTVGSSGPCSVPIEPGTTVTLEATSPSAFEGWSGACDGNEKTCTLTVTDAMTVSVDFAAEPSGKWSLLIPTSSRNAAMAFDAEGSLFLTLGRALYKIDAAGALAWTVPLASGVVPYGGYLGQRLGMDSHGNLYFLARENSVVVLYSCDAAGVPRWSRPIDSSCGRDCLVVTADDTIATLSRSPDILRVFDADGDTLWSHTPLTRPLAIDATSDGTILMAQFCCGNESGEVLRFGPLGAPLTNLASIISDVDVVLEVGPDDSVVASSSASSHVSVQRLAPDAFSLAGPVVRSPGRTDHAAVVDGLGRAVTWHTEYPAEAESTLRVIDPDRNVRFERSQDVGDWGALLPLAMAAGAGGRFAVAGSFATPTENFVWITGYEVDASTASTRSRL